jgi:hypothetical protein
MCSCLLVFLVATKMMVWPSFSQLGKIMSFSTFTFSRGVGHLHVISTARHSMAQHNTQHSFQR